MPGPNCPKRRGARALTKKKKEGSSSNLSAAAVLLVRWSTGRDVQEVNTAVRAFSADEQIAHHDAKDSSDLLAAIESWISTGTAQVLFIGAHGTSEGLKPSPKSKETLKWKRLAGVLSMAPNPIWVCLAACNSAFAISAWAKQSKGFPVSISASLCGRHG